MLPLHRVIQLQVISKENGLQLFEYQYLDTVLTCSTYLKKITHGLQLSECHNFYLDDIVLTCSMYQQQNITVEHDKVCEPHSVLAQN